MPSKKFLPWICFALTTVVLAAYLAYRWNSEDPTLFLPGQTTHGHYQIELRCDACHTPWNTVKEDSCYGCHAAELKQANDSHPKSKFTDPRNADRLDNIDASNCVTCHREHMPHRTSAMGVTMPEDYCYHCHQQTLQDRPSHRDFPFNGCAAAGCHNYHDNTALYEDFLLKHLNEPDVREGGKVPVRTLLPILEKPLVQNGPPGKASAEILADWTETGHARAGVNCTDCHGSGAKWADRPSWNSCAECHEEEQAGFLMGRHGMRLAQDLSPMTPAMARIPMHESAGHLELSCNSCHSAHRYDTREAAVDACLRCHNDPHTLAYQNSEHFALWTREMEGKGEPGTGVSCATCHMPREEARKGGETRVAVQHNQNANLRPNEKMVRGVCLACHGLGFTLNALADTNLIRTNFTGQPGISLETLRLAEERALNSKKK